MRIIIFIMQVHFWLALGSDGTVIGPIFYEAQVGTRGVDLTGFNAQRYRE